MINWLFSKTPLVFLVQGFWRDEAFSYFLAKKNVADIFILSAKDFTPPFYHIILHYWINFFGGAEIPIRILSLIFYWAIVYLTTHFLTDIFKMSLKKALFYTFLLAINPLLIYYAFEGRMYTMFAFFAALSFYSWYQKRPYLYLFSSIFGLYTHYFMIFVLAAQYFLSKSKLQLITVITFIPWIIFTLLGRGLSLDPFWIKSFNINSIINFIGSIYTGYERDFKFYNNGIFFLAISLWFLIGYGYLKIKNKEKNIKIFKFLFVWSVIIPLVILLISFLKPIFLPRYLIFSTVGLVLLLIFIIEKLPLFFKVMIIFLLVYFTYNYNLLQIKHRTKNSFRKSISEIKYLMTPGDKLYVTSELDFFTAQYYLDEKRVFIWNKTYKEIPQYVGKALIPKNKVATRLPFYPNKAFILDPWGGFTVMALY
jgi:hypothetical protein